MLLHGDSQLFCQRYFGVTTPEILSTITYHTTLHVNPTDLENRLFSR